MTNYCSCKEAEICPSHDRKCYKKTGDISQIPSATVPLVSVKSVDSCDDDGGVARSQVRHQVTCEQDTIMETGHRKDGTE